MKTYEKPEIRIETFDVEDIVTTSGGPDLPGDWAGNVPINP